MPLAGARQSAGDVRRDCWPAQLRLPEDQPQMIHLLDEALGQLPASFCRCAGLNTRRMIRETGCATPCATGDAFRSVDLAVCRDLGDDFVMRMDSETNPAEDLPGVSLPDMHIRYSEGKILDGASMVGLGYVNGGNNGRISRTVARATERVNEFVERFGDNNLSFHFYSLIKRRENTIRNNINKSVGQGYHLRFQGFARCLIIS